MNKRPKNFQKSHLVKNFYEDPEISRKNAEKGRKYSKRTKSHEIRQ
jgi:hypothetical protein